MLHLSIALLVGLAWYLDRSKERYEKWVNKVCPLPQSMRFVENEDMKEVVSEATLNQNLRQMRSILVGLLLAVAFLMSLHLISQIVN
jgi:hypothetical protein